MDLSAVLSVCLLTTVMHISRATTTWQNALWQQACLVHFFAAIVTRRVKNRKNLSGEIISRPALFSRKKKPTSATLIDDGAVVVAPSRRRLFWRMLLSRDVAMDLIRASPPTLKLDEGDAAATSQIEDLLVHTHYA